MMFPSHTLLSFVLVALAAVNASPVRRNNAGTTLGFVTHLNARGGPLNVAEMDRARVRALKEAGQLGKRAVFSIDAGNTLFDYRVEVGVGSPPTYYTLLVDTGGANTWLGAGKPYVRTKTSQNTGEMASASYGVGEWFGEEYLDTVTLSPDLVITQQSIGVAASAQGFAAGLDGILGLGPAKLSHGSVKGENTIPTVSDNLYAQGTISEEVLGVYFVPHTEPNNTGKLTFGGYDVGATISPVVYVPVTKTFPSSYFWGVDQSVTYGTETILESTAGIVDTGCSLILLATDAFRKYETMTGGVHDPNTGLLRITPEQYSKLKPLVFDIAGTPFVLSPNGQIWPRSLNARIGGDPDAVYLVIGDLKSPSGSGFDFINGYVFLQRYYSVFDATHQRIGFAATEYTLSECN